MAIPIPRPLAFPPRRRLLAALAATGVLLLPACEPAKPPAPPPPAPVVLPEKPPLPTTLTVTATDGDTLQVWLLKDGQATALDNPVNAVLEPGPVALRIMRQTDAGAWLAEEVRLTLHPRQAHLVTVGSAPLCARTQVEGRPVDLSARYLPPGAVGLAADAWNLLPLHPEQPGDPTKAGRPLVTPLAFTPATDARIEPWITAKDRVLLIANPYAQSAVCRLDAGVWQRDLSLPAHACQVVAVGDARQLKAQVRLPDASLLEERALDLSADTLPLYTLGGATRWRVGDPGHIAAVRAPGGALSPLPAGARVRLPAGEDPEHWLLVIDLDGASFGLCPIACDGPKVKGEPAPLTLRTDVRVTEIAPPAAFPDTLKNAAVSSICTDGTRLVATVRGIAYDYATGSALSNAGSDDITRACAGPTGLVLLTQGGSLATLDQGQLKKGTNLGDPTLRLAPCFGGKPAVWVYGDSLAPGILRKHYLAGGEPLVFDTSPTSEAQAITCLLPHKSGALMAHGRRIDRHTLARKQNEALHTSKPVLLLPEDGPPVIGLADLDGRLVFATEDGVYAMTGDLVAPLAEGIGGPLLPWQNGLLVHDAKSHRLFHLTGTALAPAPIAPSPEAPAAPAAPAEPSAPESETAL